MNTTLIDRYVHDATRRGAATLVRLSPGPVAPTVIVPGGGLWRLASTHGPARPTAGALSPREVEHRGRRRTRIAGRLQRSGQAS